jgi:ferredoxin
LSVTIDSSKCVGCAICIEVCPTHALFNKKGMTYFDEAKCNSCGSCDRISITFILELAADFDIRM